MIVGLTFLSFEMNVFAGMENAAYNFLRGLQEQGHMVAVFTGPGASRHADGIPLFRCSALPNPRRVPHRNLRERIMRRRRSIVADLDGFVRLHRPDVLVAWDPLWGILQYVLPHDWIGPPCVLVWHVLHSPPHVAAANRFPYKRVFAVSGSLREQLRHSSFTHPIHLLPNSIEYKHLRDIGDRSRSEHVILCNARLSPEKGVPYLVRAFARFVRRNPNYRLVLCAGDFPFGKVSIVRNQVLALIAQRNLKRRVQLLPTQAWSTVPSLIARAYAVVLPSLKESFGLAALEAMAVGRPVVAARIGNLPSLLGTSALYVRPRSVIDISHALRTLAKERRLYRLLVRRGRRRAAKYDRGVVARRFVLSLERTICR